MRYIRANSQEVFTIGKQGEKGATVVVFYKNPEFEDWAVSLSIKQNGTAAPYPKEFLTKEEIESLGITQYDAENRLFWLVNESDTAKTGISECELRYTQDTTGLTFSQTYSFNVDPALGNPTGTAPNGFQSWLNTITAASNKVTDNVSKVETAAQTAQTNANDAAAAARAAATSAGLAQTAENSMNVRINDFTTNLVMEGEEQPDNIYNKIWIKQPSQEIIIPTVEEVDMKIEDLRDYVRARVEGGDNTFTNPYSTRYATVSTGYTERFYCLYFTKERYVRSFRPFLRNHAGEDATAADTFTWRILKASSVSDGVAYTKVGDATTSSAINPIELNMLFTPGILLGISLGGGSTSSTAFTPGHSEVLIPDLTNLEDAKACIASGVREYNDYGQAVTKYTLSYVNSFRNYSFSGEFTIGGGDPYMTRSQVVDLINEMLGN